MPQQLELGDASSSSQIGALTYGWVVNRSAITHATLRKHGHAAVCTFRDTQTERVATEVRLFSHSAYLVTRRLTDFDSKRGRWLTEGEARHAPIEDMSVAKRMALAMAADLAVIGEGNRMGATEIYHG